MHCDIPCNEIIKCQVNGQEFLNCTPSNPNKSNTETDNAESLSLKANTKENRYATQRNGTPTTEKYLKTNTNSCTSSTDSGVNVDDNDNIPPPSPTISHFHSFATNTTASQCYNQFRVNNKNAERDNRVQNNEDNNYAFINNSKINIFDGGNYVDYDDEINNVNSENCNKKFKVVDVDNGSNCTRYQPKTQNIIESGKVKNISHQQNLTTSTSVGNGTITPTLATTNNSKSSLHHNEFVNLRQRTTSTSTSSPLYIAHIAKNNDDHSLVSNMRNFSGSPVVSIRSISSTIITSDSESESDVYSDTEGAHESYVIKKLGTQVTYSPQDPGIPKINSGQTILNQKVIPSSSDQVPLPHLAALANIGDSIGAAQALGSVPTISGVAQRPQIGSIALSNSSDVTFGDKHFYEGPVTIQQFLIDGRDKWKDSNGNDNPTFASENVEASANNVKDINSSAEKSSKTYQYILKRKKMIIPAVLTLTTLLVVATILVSKALNDTTSKLVQGNSEESRNIVPINSTIDTNNNHAEDDLKCVGNGTLCFVERDVWRAHPRTNSLEKQKLPLHRVVISHTASEPCKPIKICSEYVRVIQEFHMNSFNWDDIGYNFLISSDGHVYVGRGWDLVGAHTKGYNYDSVGIAFIGTYIAIGPTEIQLKACLSLLEEGVRLKKLSPDYNLYGARQLAPTESPGDMLYRKIKKWQHWSSDIH